MRAKILIVDDDPLILAALKELFCDIYEVLLAASGAEAIELVKNHPDIAVIVLDIRMSKMNGIEAASRITESGCTSPIIFFTGFPGAYSREQITREQHPFDFLTKNESPERLLRTVAAAVESWRLETDEDHLRQHALKYYGMIGSSERMLAIFRQIEQIAGSNSNIMILGSSGTGKSKVARAIHNRSNRAKKELRTFACSPRPEGLVESELFGHVRGAYTHAYEDRKGEFELANGGTLFLDEIADLDLATQSKLLHALETGRIQPLGSETYRQVDVRVICATNKDLAKAVEDGHFRSDLYYRLLGTTLDMPNLRQRREDILPLVKYFTELRCASSGMKYFDQRALDLFVEYDWPGNVREVDKRVESLIAKTASYLITGLDVEEELRPYKPLPCLDGSLRSRIDEFVRISIIQGLDRHNNNVASLAREFQMDAANLRKKIGDLGIG